MAAPKVSTKLNPMFHSSCRQSLAFAFCLGAALLGSSRMHGQNVNSSSDYTSALTSINAAVTGVTGNSYSLEFGSGLSVTPGTSAFINAGTGNTVSINGNGGSLSGGNTLTPAVIFSGKVNLSNLTIQNGLGKGGDVTDTLSDGGYFGSGLRATPGAGAGLGGGLFIATSSVVTLHNVSFAGNSALGGRTILFGAGGATTHGGDASFVLGLDNVDSNGVPTVGAGKHIAGGITAPNGYGLPFTYIPAPNDPLLGAGTSAGGQQSLSYIPAEIVLFYPTNPTDATTGSLYDGAGGSAHWVNPFVAIVAGEGKMGGGDGTALFHLGGYANGAAGGGGLVGGAGMSYAS
ncbi:MAG: hypothetical protein ACOYMS_10440, partial [Terrimicrobiaceae bacterium]